MSEEFDKSNKTLSVLSFVAAVVGLILTFIPLNSIVPDCIAIILCILAIVLGALALKKKQGIKGLAIAGMVIGIIFLAIVLIALVAGVSLLAGLAVGAGAI
ncbi:MAG TPA: hypothetical protein O0X97_05890 [Methanocorpusculum sp.]|nr:hypothetical protein [Methanocorpusculum sp.]